MELFSNYVHALNITIVINRIAMVTVLIISLRLVCSSDFQNSFERFTGNFKALYALHKNSLIRS